MGVVKSHNPFALATGMGINCGLAGLTFFGQSQSALARRKLMSRYERVPSQPDSVPSEARGNER
jgi:hypothetical protein